MSVCPLFVWSGVLVCHSPFDYFELCIYLIFHEAAFLVVHCFAVVLSHCLKELKSSIVISFLTEVLKLLCEVSFCDILVGKTFSDAEIYEPIATVKAICRNDRFGFFDSFGLFALTEKREVCFTHGFSVTAKDDVERTERIAVRIVLAFNEFFVSKKKVFLHYVSGTSYIVKRFPFCFGYVDGRDVFCDGFTIVKINDYCRNLDWSYIFLLVVGRSCEDAMLTVKNKIVVLCAFCCDCVVVDVNESDVSVNDGDFCRKDLDEFCLTVAVCLDVGTDFLGVGEVYV